MVTPLGHNSADSWSRLIRGESGIERISLFEPGAFDSQVAGEVRDFDPSVYMDRKEARRADRTTQFAFVAADEALKQAKYDVDPADALLRPIAKRDVEDHTGFRSAQRHRAIPDSLAPGER